MQQADAQCMVSSSPACGKFCPSPFVTSEMSTPMLLSLRRHSPPEIRAVIDDARKSSGVLRRRGTGGRADGRARRTTQHRHHRPHRLNALPLIGDALQQRAALALDGAAAGGDAAAESCALHAALDDPRAGAHLHSPHDHGDRIAGCRAAAAEPANERRHDGQVADCERGAGARDDARPAAMWLHR